ncbi:MAG: methyltransferase domain-containing protein [Paracoccaceae bacterium]
MEFTGNIGLWQRRIAEGPEGAARRGAVFEALAVETGQHILELGCGGGHLTRELALAVGDGGRVVGLDVSAEQLAAARTVCADAPAAEMIEGDATAMAFADGAFDGLASIQTLEYIPDVDGAIAEARRVMKPGGKAALVSVLWDLWRFHGAEPELNERMLDAWRAHCPHQMLPMELPRRLAAAGFGGVQRRPIAFLNGALNGNAYALWAAKVVAAFGIAQGIAEDDAARWLDQLAEADREGRFGFVSVPVLTTATAI